MNALLRLHIGSLATAYTLCIHQMWKFIQVRSKWDDKLYWPVVLEATSEDSTQHVHWHSITSTNTFTYQQNVEVHIGQP